MPRELAGRTRVRVIAHEIKEINHELRLGQSFFIDILRGGSGALRLAPVHAGEPKTLTPEGR